MISVLQSKINFVKTEAVFDYFILLLISVLVQSSVFQAWSSGHWVLRTRLENYWYRVNH